jgi:hypothetical protein
VALTADVDDCDAIALPDPDSRHGDSGAIDIFVQAPIIENPLSIYDGGVAGSLLRMKAQQVGQRVE